MGTTSSGRRPTTDVFDYGAKGDGQSDDTAAIQNALDAAPAGGTCLFPPPPVCYLISAPLQIPHGVSVVGPVASRPGKPRTARVPTPATLKVAPKANLDAVLTDTVFTGSAPVPRPSSAICIRGMVIDGNAAQQTGGLGHGIALLTQGSSIEACGIQNTYGSGIVFADQNVSGNEVSGAASQVENGIYRCNVYQPGISGIVVQHNVGKLTDGYIYDCIIDMNSGGSGVGMDIVTTGGWRVAYNHCYATPGNCFQLRNCSAAWIQSNYADNFGRAGVRGATYCGFQVTLAPYGATVFTDNIAISDESAGLGAGNFVYFSFASSGNHQANILAGRGSHARQRAAGTGTSTAWTYGAGLGGTLTVYGKTDMGSVTGPAISSVPMATSGVTFPLRPVTRNRWSYPVTRRRSGLLRAPGDGEWQC